MLLLLAQQVQLLDCVATAAAAAVGAGRRLSVVDRANAADDRGRDLGFGITFCSYNCTAVMLILLLLLLLSRLLLLITGRRPADLLRLSLELCAGMSAKGTSGGPVASAGTSTATTGAAAAAVRLLGLGC